MAVGVDCAVCGSLIVAPPSVAGRRKTCSRPCQAIWQRRRRAGAANPNWKGRLRTWVCGLCGTSFADVHYVARRTYCSVACRDGARRRKRPAGGQKP